MNDEYEKLTVEQKEAMDNITLANIAELVKAVIVKMGVEFIAPLDPAKLDETISKAILNAARNRIKVELGEE